MRLSKLVLVSAVPALLTACVVTSTTSGSSPASTTVTNASSNEVRTASDQTDADRRAAVRMELAALHYGRGQYETALDEIKLALQAKPELGAAYSLRGLIYASMGEEALANESFDRALRINPRDADAMHNRAWFLCQRNQFAEADRLFEQALAMPQYRESQRTLLAQGVCHAKAGKLDEAERKLSRAYELDPTNPTTAMNLSEVLYRRGEYERARFYIRRVNQREEASSPQSLWLALKIENRMGNRNGVEDFGRQLRNRFPQATETLAYNQGRFND
jgi:type IV pilus assembly protein PilF